MDEDSFRALWDAQYADVLAFCLRRLGNRHEAADATADTFLVAWRRAKEIPDQPRPWLFGVALKVMANRRRGERRRGALTSRLSHAATAPIQTLPDEPAGAVLTAFHQLAPADQQVLSLVVWEELTPREAAEVLSIPVARLSVRLHRAKQRLRKQLAAASQPTDLIAEVR